MYDHELECHVHYQAEDKDGNVTLREQIPNKPSDWSAFHTGKLIPWDRNKKIMHKTDLWSEATVDGIVRLFGTYDGETGKKHGIWVYACYEIYKPDLNLWRHSGYYMYRYGRLVAIRRPTDIIRLMRGARFFQKQYRRKWRRRAKMSFLFACLRANSTSPIRYSLVFLLRSIIKLLR